MEKEFIVLQRHCREGRTSGPSQIKINDWKIMAVMFLSLKQKKTAWDKEKAENEKLNYPPNNESDDETTTSLVAEEKEGKKIRCGDKNEGTLIIPPNKNSRFPLRVTGKCLHVLSVFYASSLSRAILLHAIDVRRARLVLRKLRLERMYSNF